MRVVHVHQRLVRSMREVIVVGAGLAGMAAAFEAGRAGHIVTLLDSAPRLGGRGTSQQVRGDILNAGPHLLRRNGPLHTLVSRCAKLPVYSETIADGKTWRSSDAGSWKPLSISSSSVRISSGGAEQQLALLRLRRTLKKASKANPNQPLADWMNEQPQIIQDEVEAWSILTTWQHPKLGITLKQFTECAIRGLWKRGLMEVQYGWADLTGRLITGLDILDVDMHSNSHVTSLRMDNDVVVGVRLKDGTELKATNVILALPYGKACNLIEDCGLSLSASVRINSHDATVLDLVLEGDFLPRGIAWDSESETLIHTIHDSQEEGKYTRASLMHIHPSGRPKDEAVEESVNRMEALLDESAIGWRGQTRLRRLTNRITVIGALPKDERANIDDLSDNGILLCGDWVNSEHILADAAVDTGLRAGRLLHP